MTSQPAVELWTLVHAGDDAKCVAAVHPMGLELQYLMNGHPLISRLFDTWEALMGQSRLWRTGLEARGWHDATARSAPIQRSA